MTEAPKCKDCAHYQSTEEFWACGNLGVSKYWYAVKERRDGNCGTEGRLFELKEGDNDRRA